MIITIARRLPCSPNLSQDPAKRGQCIGHSGGRPTGADVPLLTQQLDFLPNNIGNPEVRLNIFISVAANTNARMHEYQGREGRWRGGY